MINIKSETPWQVLREQIRHVPLMLPRNDEIIYPYLDADIDLHEIAYDDVRPTSLYVLRDNLQLQQDLTSKLGPEHNPLNLSGRLVLTDGKRDIGLIPPIVEQTYTGEQYILDGLHRTYVGRLAGKVAFTAIHISHFRPDCPASALPNDWDDVITYDTVPSDPKLKRRYRKNPLTLRRDFSALNGSQPRE